LLDRTGIAQLYRFSVTQVDEVCRRFAEWSAEMEKLASAVKARRPSGYVRGASGGGWRWGGLRRPAYS